MINSLRLKLKDAGIMTIGVATGIYSKEQLKNAGAKYIVENLKDKNKILKIIKDNN